MNEQHGDQQLREMLGAYVLGHLDDHERAQVQAHLDGCESCRAELREIAPVARLLDQVDAASFEAPPAPPPELGSRLQAQLAQERAASGPRPGADRRSSSGWLVAAAVVLVALLVGGAVGGVVGRTTAPQAAPVPTEAISMTPAGGPDVTVESADLVAHTWGVELRIVAEGFVEGQTYRAQFRTEEGLLIPAGEFLGVGSESMTCNLQSAVLREEVVEVMVTDERGRTVLAADLRQPPESV